MSMVAPLQKVCTKAKTRSADCVARFLAGAAGRTRTADLLITNQLLYQLSHSSILDFEAVYMCVSSESPVTAFILYRINTGIAREIFAFLCFCVIDRKRRKGNL